MFRDTHLFICVVSIFYVIMSIFGRLFAYAKTGLRLQSFSRYCIIGGRFFRSRSKTAAYRKTNGKKDIRLRPCRVQRMPSMASAEHEFAYRKLTALTGCQWFTEESSLQCKLEVQECTGRIFLNDDIRGDSECVPPCTRLNDEICA